MKESSLFLLVAVLVETLLLSDVFTALSIAQPHCASTGAQCNATSECCYENCCANGICKENRGGKCNPLNKDGYQDGDTGQSLKDPDNEGNKNRCKKSPQSDAVVDPCSRRPRPHECLVKELCTNFTCPEGGKCYVIGGGDCSPGHACIFRVPSPVCANPDPCNKTICNAGFKCVNIENDNNPPHASCQIVDDPCQFLSCPYPSERCYIKRNDIEKCESTTRSKRMSTSITPICAASNPCNDVMCREGYMCIIVKNGYYQSFAQCVPTDSVCAYTICGPGESCSVLEPRPHTPLCVSDNTGKPKLTIGNPCDGMLCEEYERCYYEKTCMKTSCYLEPRCVPSNTCEYIECREDYFCRVYEEKGLPIGRCTPFSDPCAFTVCTNGAMCIILKTYPPQPKCTDPNPQSPCYSKKCPRNTKCKTYTVNGTLQAQCVYISSPCDGLICPDNYYCIKDNDNCGNIPNVECVPLKLCDIVKCPNKTHYCQEFNNGISTPEAFCVPLIKDPCQNVSCSDGQKCYILDRDCLNYPLDGYCTSADPCRINRCKFGEECVVVDKGIFGHQYECVLSSSPCDNIACPEFQRCYLESSSCLLVRSQPNPVCAYSSPCNHTKCPNGTTCFRKQEGSSPPKAQCVSISNPCFGVQCPDHHKCYLRDVECIRAPCPPVPECAYYDPCMVTDCAKYYKCEVRQIGNNPSTAECVVDYEALCKGVHCLEFQKCYLENVTCITTPCPPQPACSYYNPCMLAKCSAGYKCVVVENGYYAPTATCVPDREIICEGTVCPMDQKCYLQDVVCVTAPCRPVPQCAYENPCILTDCASEIPRILTGYMCHVVDHGNYPPTAECVLNPKLICLYHLCPLHQQCYLMDVHCIKAPCYPEPVCAYSNPCMFATCGEGYKCVVIEEKPKPPVPYCIHNYDVCFGVSCRPGYSCYVKDTECTDLDCYRVAPSAVCSLPDPCTEKECPVNSKCEVRQMPRNNPPEARCIQPESPCENIVCETNERCYIKDFECNETGCFDIVPVGVCWPSDPCNAAHCPKGTVCFPVKLRENPPEAVCEPLQTYDPCTNYLCEEGKQCYVKDVNCGNFSCYSVYPTAVCSNPNPCLSTKCTGNTVCVVNQTRNNPPVAKCKPPRILCDKITCHEGEQCYIKDYECDESGCRKFPKLHAHCAVSNPCSTTLCVAMSSCYNVQIRDNPPQAVCIRTPSGNECQGMKCNSGNKCYVKDIECNKYNCTAIDPVGACSLSSPCSVVRCAGPCVEVQERENPPEASCQPIDYCHKVNCTEGQECFIKDYKCSENECSHSQPTGVCAYTDPCSYRLCETGTFCIVQQIRDNPPFALCTPMGSPCDMVDCKPADWCYVKDFECDKYSCRLIKPTAVCAHSDPCYNTSCLANSVCIPSQIRRNPQQANCISYSQLCNNVHCGDGDKCYIAQVYCYVPPCPTLPMCLLADQCAIITCLPGYRCVNRHYDVGPPFAECVELDDLCDGLTCTDGHECYLREKMCLCPPCGYEAVCVYPNPCILALCPEQHGCYVKRVGRLVPFAVCYPIDDPCKGYECLPGQECLLTKIACQEHLPCPVPVCTGDPTNYLCSLARCGPGYECVVDMDVTPLVAKCIPHDDPCDYTICPDDSQCVVLEKYPPVGRCLNTSGLDPCFVVRCKAGYQCVNTPTDPSEAQCIPTCAICPPTTDCIILDSNPQIIRCNPNPKWLITYNKK